MQQPFFAAVITLLCVDTGNMKICNANLFRLSGELNVYFILLHLTFIYIYIYSTGHKSVRM